MSQEQEDLTHIVKKMDKLAVEHYDGNAADNSYSIFQRLTDMEKIQFLRYGYKFLRAILGVIDIDIDSNHVSKPRKKTEHNHSDGGCCGECDGLEDEDVDKRLEIADKRELMRIKHRAIVTMGQIILIVLAVFIVIMMVMSFVSPQALNVLGQMGKIVSVIIGG